MPYATANGCNLFYEANGEGVAVVYVHGGFASLDTLLWNLQPGGWTWQNDFAATFRFITYDRRGCFRSSSPDDGYDLPTQASDLAALLDHLNVADAHIIGSSAGGPIALLFAATYPQQVRSLVLVGTALDLFPQGEPGSDAVRQHLAILEREGAEAAFDWRPPQVEVTWGELWDVPEMRARGTLDEYRERLRRWHEQARQLGREQRIHYYATELRNMHAYISFDIGPYAARVTAPALIIHGSNDQMVPQADAEELARALPSAQVIVVEGGQHTLMIRDVVARQQVIAWMQGIDRQRLSR